MRLAKCVGLTSPITVIGSKPKQDPTAVVIVPGWEGDLDQVVGESDGEPLTLADALGDHLRHFEDVTSGERFLPPGDTPAHDDILRPSGALNTVPEVDVLQSDEAPAALKE